MTPSQQLLDRLYRRYNVQIRAYLNRMTGDAQEAEDLTQEVFLKAYRQLAGRGGTDNMRPWLFRVATLTCFDYYRRRYRRVRTVPIPDDSELPSLGDAFEQSQVAAAVVTSLRRLTERHRAVLILKDVNGFRHDEIAAAMGISEGAAQVLLHRARDQFRSAYSQVVAETPLGCPVADRAALDLVGSTLTPAQRCELEKHARGCPECRARLAGRAFPAGTLGFLLPWLPGPETDALLFPPPAVAPPASGVANGLHGFLSQALAALLSKAAVATIATALVVGGQLTTQDVIPREPVIAGAATDAAQADRARAQVPTADTATVVSHSIAAPAASPGAVADTAATEACQPLAPGADTTTAGRPTDALHDLGGRPTSGSGAVQRQAPGSPGPSRQERSGPPKNVSSADPAPGNREMSSRDGQDAPAAQLLRGAEDSNAAPLESGSVPVGNLGHVGMTIASAGGHSVAAGTDSELVETETVEAGARGDEPGVSDDAMPADAGSAPRTAPTARR